MNKLKIIESIFKIFCILSSLFHLYTAGFGFLEPTQQRSLHLMFMLPLAFIFSSTDKTGDAIEKEKDLKEKKKRIVNLILALVSFVVCFYVYLQAVYLTRRIPFVSSVTTMDIVVGIVLVFLILEAVRRVVAPAMMWLIIFSFLYVVTAPYLPGFLFNARMPFPRFIEMVYMFQDTGILGTITGVSATYAAVFVIFACFIAESGLGDFFTNFSIKLFGNRVGGPAKVAVISSGLFGSISGVAAANVYATGSFTIPMMTKLGYRPQFAGATEAAASTGGLLMPPIMGVGAFVMAQITGIPYSEIMIRALPAAIMYYGAIFVMVHLTALKEDLLPLDKTELPSWRKVFNKFYLIIPLVVLVVLIIRGLTPPYAAFISILVAVSVLAIGEFLVTKRLGDLLTIIVNTLEKGARNTAMVAIACAGAGIVVSVVTVTGLSVSATSIVVSLSNDILLVALFFSMIVTIVLGMGMPCVAAYIVAISIIGPTLSRLGIGLLQAHMFTYYFAVLAEITPPVCIASYAAASISLTDPLKTGFESAKLAIAGFLVPFIMIYSPGILLLGDPLMVFFDLIISAVLISLLSIIQIGYFKKIHLSVKFRSFLFCICIALFILIIKTKV